MTKFKKTIKFTKINVNRVPDDKPIVYKIKDKSGNNLYTGIAGKGRVQDRLNEHKTVKGEIIPGGTKFQIAQVKNSDDAIKLEKQIIKNEQPKFNLQGK